MKFAVCIFSGISGSTSDGFSAFSFEIVFDNTSSKFLKFAVCILSGISDTFSENLDTGKPLVPNDFSISAPEIGEDDTSGLVVIDSEIGEVDTSGLVVIDSEIGEVDISGLVLIDSEIGGVDTSCVIVVDSIGKVDISGLVSIDSEIGEVGNVDISGTVIDSEFISEFVFEITSLLI